MQRLINPTPIFPDVRGTLLDSGQLYYGVAGADPQTSPINVFWDAGLTIPAAQPLRTIGGRIVNGAVPSYAYIEEDDYSLRVLDAFDVLVDYTPNLSVAGVAYQPIDSDLTAIAALGTTAFGRALLALTDTAALQAVVAIPKFTGGTVNSDITRAGNGVVRYWVDIGQTSGRCWLLPTGSADPSGAPGDTVYYY